MKKKDGLKVVSFTISLVLLQLGYTGLPPLVPE